MSQQITRRSVIGGIAGLAITSLTGCTGNNPSENPTESAKENADIETISADGMSLEIEFSNENIDTVQLNSEGARVARTEIPHSTVASFTIGTSYNPGKHELIGISDGKEVLNETIIIEPDLEIVNVGLGKRHPDKLDHYLPDTDQSIFFEIKNTGTGADLATELKSPDTPQTISEKTGENSGLINPDSSELTDDPIPLPVNETVLLVSESIFLTIDEDKNWYCGETYDFDIELLFKNSPNMEETLTFDTEYDSADYDSDEKQEIWKSACQYSPISVTD